MSSKTRTRKTRATGSARTLRSVPDQDTTAAPIRTDSEDKLWAALHAHPASTTTVLANRAVIGKSTAQKILAKWAADGSATRTAGITDGGHRADLWTVTDTDAVPDTVSGDLTAGESTVDTAPVDSGHDKPTTEPVAPEAIADITSADDITGLVNTHPVATAVDSTADDTQGTTGPDDVTGPQSTPADETAPTTAEATDGGGTDAASGGNGKAERLAPGGLRGLVEDHLRDHPGEEFGPTAIAHALGGKSSGAVSNALDKLVADGTAVKTNDKPRRFALAPAERAASVSGN